MVAEIGATKTDQVCEGNWACGSGNGEVATVADSAGCSDGTATQECKGFTRADGCGTRIGVDAAEAVGGARAIEG